MRAAELLAQPREKPAVMIPVERLHLLMQRRIVCRHDLPLALDRSIQCFGK
jgi:hypothetical protein